MPEGFVRKMIDGNRVTATDNQKYRTEMFFEITKTCKINLVNN
jgi:hypothetical protein